MSIESTSSTSSTEEMEETDNLIENTKLKYYQIQHTRDEYYKLVFMGYYDNKPEVNLGTFKLENESMQCVLCSEFVLEKDIFVNNILDLITLVVIKNNIMTRIKLGVIIEEGNEIKLNTDDEYKCNLLIYVEYNNTIDIIKNKLIYPGDKKILYYIISEIHNDRINKIINRTD